MKENFYHGMLLGLLKAERSWIVKSNAESGIGYTDPKTREKETRNERGHLMLRKASGAINVGIIRERQKNGDIYIYERKTKYDPDV